MEASILLGVCSISSSITSPIPTNAATFRPPPLCSFSRNPNPNPNPERLLLARGRIRKRSSSGAGRSTVLVAPAATIVDGVAVPDVSGTVEITWQIVVGALAGITPFIVAGIEFGKRIVAQKKCEVCGGSGLVLEEDSYYRCPNCGGFLPWQSWKRFFTG